MWKTLKAISGVIEISSKALAVASALVAVGTVIYLNIGIVKSHIAEIAQFTSGLQALVILVLTPWQGALPKFRERPEYREAIQVSQQFRMFWFFLWVFWLFFYLVSFYGPFAKGQGEIVHVLKDLFGLLAAGALFLCYLVMVERSLPPYKTEWYRSVSLVFGGAVLFVAFEAVIHANANELLPNFREYSDAAQGLISGVALALFVGRLESKLIDSPRWILALLYAYAVIQFSYPVLGGSNLAGDTQPALSQLTIANLALAFKVVLYWELRRLIVSGQLTYYMLAYRQLSEDTERAKSKVLNDILETEPLI